MSRPASQSLISSDSRSILKLLTVEALRDLEAAIRAELATRATGTAKPAAKAA